MVVCFPVYNAMLANIHILRAEECFSHYLNNIWVLCFCPSKYFVIAHKSLSIRFFTQCWCVCGGVPPKLVSHRIYTNGFSLLSVIFFGKFSSDFVYWTLFSFWFGFRSACTSTLTTALHRISYDISPKTNFVFKVTLQTFAKWRTCEKMEFIFINFFVIRST